MHFFETMTNIIEKSFNGFVDSQWHVLFYKSFRSNSTQLLCGLQVARVCHRHGDHSQCRNIEESWWGWSPHTPCVYACRLQRCSDDWCAQQHNQKKTWKLTWATRTLDLELRTFLCRTSLLLDGISSYGSLRTTKKVSVYHTPSAVRLDWLRARLELILDLSHHHLCK